ncbi:toxin-antitoxin system, toxin component [Streptomyces triticagri]|uniref:Toxin-antitoxin system, toxin component n=1 Tax=Streptomyces triticagri TaxID=2293568 RepID=A0A372M7J2_9ACTN|nr:toxin-antitoxin system, toxin component [Streptomyces triticagri]RFU86829.1 toxin-antitoxin system, toxin component [Streptomyces triticagri]
MRRRRPREVKDLITRLGNRLDLPVPAEPEQLFTALLAAASDLRGRRIVLLKEEFPHQTATGLWLDLPDRDLIVVDARATPFHQLAIICHEIWHILKGDCGHHDEAASGAAQALRDRSELHSAVRQVAARTAFDEASEQDAETFALYAAAQFRSRLQDGGAAAPAPATDRSGIGGRISASLGDGRPQV